MGSVSRVSSHCGRTGSLSNGPEPPSPRTSGRIRLFGSAFAKRKFPRGPGRLEVVRAGAVQHDGGTLVGEPERHRVPDACPRRGSNV